MVITELLLTNGIKQMSNHLKFCSCKGCKAGRHTKSGKQMVKQVIRTARHKAKLSLKQGEEPSPVSSVGYTD